MKTLNLILIFIIFCRITSSIILECKYFNHPGYGYYCGIENRELRSLSEFREITEVQGQHLEGKFNDDVKSLWSNNVKINFLPQNITKFFKNLETIQIYNGILKEITKNDLKEFGDNLKNLWLDENEIEVIKFDLFEFNKNLESISFSDNKIKIIEDQAFDRLEYLKEFFLQFNPCTTENDKVDFKNREKIKELIKIVEKICKT